MPDLSLANGTYNNTAAVVTSLTLADNAGVNGKVFTQTTANVGTLPLTGYDLDNNNDSVAAISATDSINTAIQRLEYRLDSLDATADSTKTEIDGSTARSTLNNGVFALQAIKETDGKIVSMTPVEVDAAGAAATALGTAIGGEEDTESSNTIHGAKAYAKAYADEQIAQITVTYIPMIDDLDNPGEKIPDPNAEPTTLTLNELFIYIKGLEQRIYELEHPEEGNNEGGGE